MKVRVSLEGLDGLTAALASDTKKAKLQTVIKKNAANLQRRAVRKVPVDTGFLKRSIQPPSFSSDGMYAVVRATAEYAPYVEYGTRFMAAQPFLGPAYNEIRQQFLDDVRKVVTGK